jgi:N utilization substance protein A
MFKWLGRAAKADPEPQPRAADTPRQDEAEAKWMELGVDGALKEIAGVTARMLVVFGENSIKTIEDLAGCATDDLDGWTETDDGGATRHRGILDGFGLSRNECAAMIMRARVKAGWIGESEIARSA